MAILRHLAVRYMQKSFSLKKKKKNFKKHPTDVDRLIHFVNQTMLVIKIG